MKKYLLKFTDLKAEFGWKAIIDALFAGVIYATIIFVPIYIILVEVAMVFMYRLYTFVVLITFAAMMNVFIINKLAMKTLYLKKPDAQSDIPKLMLFHAGFWMLLVLIIGLVFIFVLIPILWI